MRGFLFFISVILSLSGSISAQAMGRSPGPPDLDSNLEPLIRYQIRQDLSLIYRIPFQPGAGSLHQLVFGTIDGQNYQDYFESRVDSIEAGDCGDKKGMTIACANRVWFFFKKVWLTNRYMDPNNPQAFRLATLFHEARHTENDHSGWPHIICPKYQVDSHGILYGHTDFANMGVYGCDDQALGAYGVEAILMKNLQTKCKDCSEKFRLDAEMNFDEAYTRITDPAARERIYREMVGLDAVEPTFPVDSTVVGQ